jgi:hypothetical protein
MAGQIRGKRSWQLPTFQGKGEQETAINAMKVGVIELES